MIEQYIQALTELTMVKKPNFGNGASVLSLLYEAYSELNLMDTEQIKAAFKTLYHTMNGKSLEEMDVILYPVCALCREHERSGFVEGVKVGLHLSHELK